MTYLYSHYVESLCSNQSRNNASHFTHTHMNLDKHAFCHSKPGLPIGFCLLLNGEADLFAAASKRCTTARLEPRRFTGATDVNVGCSLRGKDLRLRDLNPSPKKADRTCFDHPCWLYHPMAASLQSSLSSSPFCAWASPSFVWVGISAGMSPSLLSLNQNLAWCVRLSSCLLKRIINLVDQDPRVC